jgi:hypothetical protein
MLGVDAGTTQEEEFLTAVPECGFHQVVLDSGVLDQEFHRPAGILQNAPYPRSRINHLIRFF